MAYSKGGREPSLTLKHLRVILRAGERMDSGLEKAGAVGLCHGELCCVFCPGPLN